MSSVNNGLPQKWQDRFAFFDKHGAPNTRGFKEALKALPSWGEKIKIGGNWLAFFFGPIYFLILGLWKKALIGFAITVAIGVVCAFLPTSVGALLSRGLSIGMALLWSMSANYAFYLKKVKNQDSWNFFEGIRW